MKEEGFSAPACFLAPARCCKAHRQGRAPPCKLRYATASIWAVGCMHADLRTVSWWAVVIQVSGMLGFNMATIAVMFTYVTELQASA